MNLYRSTLAAAGDTSITVISVGLLTNLAALLNSTADDNSALSGSELISTKVAELVVMGGQYPSGWEFNFGGVDPTSTNLVLDRWPRNIPITFSGSELGGKIYSGRDLAQYAPKDSPVLAAYQWYCGRCSTIRESWDPITLLYGVFGVDGFSKIGMDNLFAYANEYGVNTLTASNGSNAWINDTAVTNQHWLKLADEVSNSSVASLLTRFYAHDPLEASCMGTDMLSLRFCCLPEICR